MGTLLLISGDDEATIGVKAKQVVDKLAGPTPDDFSLDVIRHADDRESVDILGDLIGSIMTPSFLGGTKTVWLQNFGDFSLEAAASVKSPSPVAKAIARLAEIINEGIPDDINLVISATGIDSRKALTRACKAKGKVENYSKPDISKRGWERNVQELLRQNADDRGMKLSGQIINYLVEVIGSDTGRLVNEIEKLYCFAGPQPTLNQVREICTGSREASHFALTTAFGQRNLDEVFRAISQTLDHDKNPDSACIRMTRQMGSYFRDLLQIKLLLLSLKSSPERLASRIKAMTAEENEQFAGNRGLSMGEWQLKFKAQEADRYDGPELVEYLSWLAQFDRLNVSSALPRRLALETLALRIITGHRRPQSR